VSDVSPCGEVGKHHITLRRRSNTSLRDSTTSLRRSRYFTIYKHSNLCCNRGGKRGIIMAESKMRELSMEFSVDIINLVKFLKSNHESVIANQIGRSGTSIGANIHEAQYAQGKKDFISKLEIALKEASETGYWLELLHRTNYIDDQQYKILSDKCSTLRVILVSSCRTAKSNQNNK